LIAARRCKVNCGFRTADCGSRIFAWSQIRNPKSAVRNQYSPTARRRSRTSRSVSMRW